MIKATVKTITPKMAEKMLDMNTDNFRKIDPRRVDRYSKEIESGNWEVNGESIKFHQDGSLKDGQHRLSAIVNTGEAVKTVVVTGIEVDGRTIDRGRPRTVSQWLSYSGYKNTAVLAATAKLCVAYEKGIWGDINFGGIASIVDSEIFDFVDKNHDKVSQCMGMVDKARHVIPASTLGAIVFAGTKDYELLTDSETAVWFVNSLASGEDLNNSDPVLHLRNKFLDEKNKAKKTTPYMKRMLASRVWNMTVAGESASSGSSIKVVLTGPNKQKPISVLDQA